MNLALFVLMVFEYFLTGFEKKSPCLYNIFPETVPVMNVKYMFNVKQPVG